jgi:plastocyanin
LAAWLGAAPGKSMPIDVRGDAQVDTAIIEIYSTNAGLEFDPDKVRARAGSTVKIRFVNESALSHNVVFLKNAKDLDELGEAAAHAAATAFVPMQHKAKLFGWSPLAAAGKTVEFTITVPPVGEYLFACFVDGHFNVMVGKLISFKAAEKE